MSPHEERTIVRILEICTQSKISLATVARLGRAAIAGKIPTKTAALAEKVAEYQQAFAENRLTPEKIAETLAILANGATVLETSKIAGISPSEVYRVRRGAYKGGPEGGHTELPPLTSKRGWPKKQAV